MLPARPGSTISDFVDALATLLVGTFDLADAVDANVEDDCLTVVVTRPRYPANLEIVKIPALGSLIASVCAAVAVDSFKRPVTIRGERVEPRGTIVELQLLR